MAGIHPAIPDCLGGAADGAQTWIGDSLAGGLSLKYEEGSEARIVIHGISPMRLLFGQIPRYFVVQVRVQRKQFRRHPAPSAPLRFHLQLSF
jgi:hypothetical protein